LIVTYLKQPLKRYTFQAPKIKKWVESQCAGKTVLNLFGGPTRLNGCTEISNDIDYFTEPKKGKAPEPIKTTYHMDALDCVKMLKEKGVKVQVVLDDPPYSYRKSMEKYKGNLNSRFKQICDILPDILAPDGIVITFGYHSRVMSDKRGFRVRELCIISHAGAQRDTFASVEDKLEGDTIATVEQRINKPLLLVTSEKNSEAT
jgi:hypothetical protein